MNQIQRDALKLVVEFARLEVVRRTANPIRMEQALFLHELKQAANYILKELIPQLEQPSLQDVLDECTLWAFGVEEFQPIEPERILSHLQEELDELKANPTSGEEMIDCLMLLHHLIVFNKIDAVAELQRKLEINRKRNWEKRKGIKHSKHIEVETLQD